MTHRPPTLLLSQSLALALAWTLAVACAQAATDAPTVPGRPAAGAAVAASRTVVRSATLPAQGLFEGDRLSAATQARLDSLTANAADLDVEVVLLVPAGPWKLEGQSVDEHSLTPARLAALRQHLTRRGPPAQRVYVESRIDRSAAEPRLIVELVGVPAPH